ncbi:MAG: Amuc_1102 family pilus-like protein [Verrucomicrobiales bacterium]
MKKAVFLSGIFLLVLVAAPRASQAQAKVKVDIKRIEVDVLPTPQYAHDGKDKSYDVRNWVEIEVEFEAEGRTENDFVDDLKFTYYVMMNDKETMFVEDLIHMNVKLGEKTYSVVYLSPTTTEKLLGREASSAGVVAGVAIEVRLQGALIGGDATISSKTKWWNEKPQTRGILRKKSETPFAPLWWDRFADVKSGE